MTRYMLLCMASISLMFGQGQPGGGGGGGASSSGTVWRQAAGYNGPACFPLFDTPAANAPTCVAINSGSVQSAALNFATGTTQYIQYPLQIPVGYVTGKTITLTLTFETAGADIGALAAMNVTFARVPLGAGIANPTFGAPVVLSATAAGTLITQNMSSSTLALPGSSAAGDILYTQIALDATNALTSDLTLVAVKWKFF